MTAQQALNLLLGTMDERIKNLEDKREMFLDNRDYLEASDPDIRINELNMMIEKIQDFMKEV